ncbi:maltose ABC transporter substrate-binding protein [Helcobacillus massiliensis]|uniref:sugar ABC transporter substrate-binding protein n=1 Tax=Helcobacillus massiliensis TaxID=521392 RepID=UPI002553BC25|nr:maltose ABC transporter substrate-binding protein [Helcobacillus massiliensis]MDK7742315.1 maltose ABC transporter substrate-binding protein [Helcobacillus massiliensis]
MKQREWPATPATDARHHGSPSDRTASSHHSKENTVLIRRHTFLAMGAATLGAATLAACGGGSTEKKGADSGASDAGGAEGAAPAVPKNADLVIWADEKKAAALQEPAKAWGESQGLKVAVQTVADELQSSFITANQAGNGPDLLLGAHDWIGNLVQNGAVSPVQLPAEAKKALAPVGLDAVTYDGQTYGMPYAVECIALFANKKLTDKPSPATFEELVEAGKAGGADTPLSLPVGEEGDPYAMHPLYTSAGGYLFGEKADGGLNPEDVGVGKDGSVSAGEKMQQLGKEGVLKTSITNDNAISLFTDGKAAYLISGPWALADIKKAKIDFELSPIPGFEGLEEARPFAGVNAFYVASKGKNAAFASQFVNAVAASPDLVEQMFAKNELPPVNLELQKKLADKHPEVVKFAQFSEKAEPMPSIPQMAAVWKPLGIAEANIIGGADPKSSMEGAGKAITDSIKG